MTDAERPKRLPEDLERIVGPASLRKPDGLTVACYTFPHFHRSAYNDRLLGPGWTEYVLMRGCRPWFPGHNQPRTPMLGELDERLPSTWDVYFDLAKQHGVDAFIFDWYWYGGGPALHEALEEGFLGSARRDGVQFAVMWTNHPWAYWFPTAGVGVDPSWPEIRDPSGLGAYEIVDPGPRSTEEVWRRPELHRRPLLPRSRLLADRRSTRPRYLGCRVAAARFRGRGHRPALRRAA